MLADAVCRLAPSGHTHAGIACACMDAGQRLLSIPVPALLQSPSWPSPQTAASWPRPAAIARWLCLNGSSSRAARTAAAQRLQQAQALLPSGWWAASRRMRASSGACTGRQTGACWPPPRATARVSQLRQCWAWRPTEPAGLLAAVRLECQEHQPLYDWMELVWSSQNHWLDGGAAVPTKPSTTCTPPVHPRFAPFPPCSQGVGHCAGHRWLGATSYGCRCGR